MLRGEDEYYPSPVGVPLVSAYLCKIRVAIYKVVAKKKCNLLERSVAALLIIREPGASTVAGVSSARNEVRSGTST